MKNSILSIIVITALWFTFSSCTKVDNTPLVSVSETSGAVQEGKWKVTLFLDCSEDETYHFAGYEFVMDSTGVVTATNGTTVVSGTWNIRTDSNHNKFILNFGKNDPLHKLNEDWHIIEQTPVLIRLEDVGKKSGETEFLTFEKK
jgi:hypothetical protein